MQRDEKLLNKINQLDQYLLTEPNPSNNATIRREYVKCGKANCQERHDPYYYAYWKDSNNNKKLKKKYVGKHFQGRKNNEDKNDIKTVKSASTNYEGIMILK